MTVPLERQKNIADVAPRVREQLGLGSAALSDVGDFATAAQGEKADNALPAGMLPITSSVQGLTAIDLPDGMTAIRTNGFNAMGDLGAWPLAVEVTEDASPLEAWQRQTNGGMRRFELRADVVSVKMFGAKGDGATDDATAIANALAYWKATGCTLVFPQGSYRTASGVLVDMSGIASVGNIMMFGAIKPDPGIGAALTFRNVRGGLFVLAVNGGGQTADYRIADPVGGDEAFRFVNCFGGVIDWVRGQNYKGRVLRITSDTDNLGPDGFGSQGMLIRNCYFDSSAKITDPEPTRLDQGVGQGFFIDTRTAAFGTIERVWWFWELYGSVIDSTTDLTLNDGESLYRGVSGLQLRGLISFSGGSLKLGSEMAGFSEPLLTISDSADGVTNTQNSRIRDLFLVGGAIGLSAKNVGVSAGQSLDIGQINSRLNTAKGILLDNCRKMTIGNLTSFGDRVGLHISGASDDIDIKASIRSSKAQAVIIDAAVTGNIKIAGRAFDGNEDNVADVSLIDVNTVAPVFFNDFIASSAKVDYLYDIVSGNSTSIEGGRAVIAGITARFRNQPNRAINVRGWSTANAGQVTLPASATSVVVSHGLVKAPDTVMLTPRGQLGGVPFVPTATRTSTQFTIQVPASVASAQSIDWVARCDYGKI
ncbi:glycosyl hydrolase family 28-related protein [Agrobacterium pusense]|uniref:glycosyl hydrolase family 28-related protein n=1 Tax=Agrobacterium pusense TaxID=648995 RepID=UPI0018E5480E|nr:glycosyl hydrolase family 28-related protein [Agrobacterium pusense]